MQEGKVVAWGSFTNSWGNKRSKKQERKEKVHSAKHRVPEARQTSRLSSINNARKKRRITEEERLEIPSRKLKKKRKYQRNISSKDGHNKGQNQRSRRDGKNTQKNCTKKILMTRIITLVWSLTQSQAFWSVKSRGALGSTPASKASGDDGIPAQLFKILKDDAMKVLHSVCQQIWKT